jgi:hypothetical protein
VQVKDVKFDGSLLTGKVINQTGVAVKAVKVDYEVIDSQGKTVESGTINITPSVIPVGGSVSFQQAVNSPGAKVKKTSATWEL